MSRLPRHRRPTPPGEILLRQYLEPLDLTLTDFSKRIGVTRARLSELVNGRRGVSPDTALRLARVLGTTPDLWLNLQQRVDLYDALHSRHAAKIARLRPLSVP